MPTNWKSLVEKQNASTFVLPSGWDSRTDIALQLDCSEEKVDDHLRPGLKSGKVIKQTFRVWDEQIKRVIVTVAYRDASKDTPAAHAGRETGDIRASIQTMRTAGKTWNEIGASFGRSGESVRALYRKG